MHNMKTAKTAKRDRGEKSRTKPAPLNDQKEFNCTRYGYKHEYSKYLAFGQTCKLCQRRNNFAKMCKSQGHTRKMHVVEPEVEVTNYS